MPLQCLLGEHPAAVRIHFEHAARRLDQLDLRMGEGLTDFGRQTGGPRLIVSDDAEFDGDAHAPTIVVLDMPRHTAELARIA